MFKSFDLFASKTFKLFGFPIFWLFSVLRNDYYTKRAVLIEFYIYMYYHMIYICIESSTVALLVDKR